MSDPRLLLIESSTQRTLVGLTRSAHTVAAAPIEPTQRHARGLVPAIAWVLSEARLRGEELDAIAVGVGPGSFTGLRVGLTAAKVLAYAWNRPVIALDSLLLVARNLRGIHDEIVVVADAQKDGWYVARFRHIEDAAMPAALAPLWVASRAAVLESLGESSWLTGPALETWRDRPSALTRGRLAEPSYWSPTLKSAAECALWAWKHRDFADVRTLEPRYMRPSAAEQTRNQPQAGAGAAAP